MSKRQRQLIHNITLEQIHMGGLDNKDFTIVTIIGIVSLAPNFILMTRYSEFDAITFIGALFITGMAGTLLYRIEYKQRTIDLILAMIKYRVKGDRLYESVKFKEGK